MKPKAEPTAREALILENLPYARYLARATAGRIPRWISMDDAVQEASLALILGLARWNPGRLLYREAREGLLLREFLKRRIIGRILDLGRRRKGREAWVPQVQESEEPIDVTDPGPTPEELLSHKETRQAVDAALSRLPTRLRQTMRWTYWGELTRVEIGRLDHGVSEERVAQLQRAALQRLRRSPELARLRRRVVS